MSFRRIQRVNVLIKRELNQIFLRDFEFPDGVLVTITRAEASSNLIQTKVYISVLPEAQTEKIFRILNGDIYAIQQKINKRLRMRPVPKIKFVEEEKTKEAGKIEELLEKIRKKEGA